MPQKLTFDSAERIMKRYYETLNKHDLTLIPDIYDEEIRLDDDAWPQELLGYKDIELFLSSLWRAFPDKRFELLAPPYLSPDGQSLAVHVRGEGTHLGLLAPGYAPTGKRVSYEFVSLYQIKDDRMVYGRAISNGYKTAIQLGLLPPPGSFAENTTAFMQRKLQGLKNLFAFK